MAKIKKRLTQDQEFQVMSMVLDKFLWIGTLLLLYALYLGVAAGEYGQGISWGIAGIVIWLIFGILLIREYEIIR
ncbi:MAG: hypothetical protein ACE5DM_02705 [Candidatus Nanoarchaeia archaeon]